MKIEIFNKSSLKNISLVLASLLTIFLILEIGIRLRGVFEGQSFFANPENKFTKTASSIIPFRTFGKHLYAIENQQKFILDRYDKKYPYIKDSNTFRVVCLGGSTTENLSNYQKSGIHYPMLLEELLQKQYPDKKIEVINTSFAAYTTVHSIILLAFDVIYWKPDLVILSHNINDLTANYWPNFTTDYSNKYSHPFYINPYSSLQPSTTDAIFQHFRIYWWIKIRLEKLTAGTQHKSIQRKSYGNEPPQEGLNAFRNNLTTFISIAKQNNIPVLLTTEPFESSIEMFNRHIPNKAYNDVVVYPLQDEFIEHHKRYNSEIAKVAGLNGVMYINLDKEFNANKNLFSDLVHYTDDGVIKLATSIASFITSNELIKNQSLP